MTLKSYSIIAIKYYVKNFITFALLLVALSQGK